MRLEGCSTLLEPVESGGERQSFAKNVVRAGGILEDHGSSMHYARSILHSTKSEVRSVSLAEPY